MAEQIGRYIFHPAYETFKDSKFADRAKIKANEMALKKIRSSQGSHDKTNRFLEFFENQQ